MHKMNKVEAIIAETLNAKIEALCTKWNDRGINTSGYGRAAERAEELRAESKFVSSVLLAEDKRGLIRGDEGSQLVLEVFFHDYVRGLVVNGSGIKVDEEFDQIFSDLGWEYIERDEMALYFKPLALTA